MVLLSCTTVQRLSRSHPLRTKSRTNYGPLQQCRTFTSSRRSCGHYQTLSIPRNASKAQIKASFYQLSKLYHPDRTDDPTAKSKFQAVSEAYSVLGDDRKRRSYDKTLGPGTTFTPPHSQRYGAAYETGKRKGATHAWEYSRPASSFYHHPNAPHNHPGSSANQHTYPRPSTNPFDSPHVQNAAGSKTPPPPHHRRPLHHGYRPDPNNVHHISGLWRAVQVVGVVLLVATIGGGFGASAA